MGIENPFRDDSFYSPELDHENEASFWIMTDTYISIDS
jgi:hypothetical protein